MNYEVVIGIEIHLELKTKTKMFSGAPVASNQKPNSCVSAIDIALPGTLPCLNKEAVRLGLMAAKALNCEIDDLLRFDRKNYYYSDLPKGYQITQQFHPLGTDGYLEIETNNELKKIRIDRIHLEEDTAKQFHQNDGTYIDYNRCGVPLVEIVSKADMRGAEEAMTYVEKLRSILYYLGVSDCKMEEGSLRCDVNISLRPFGYDGYGSRVEIKNLNSIANIGRAVEAETKRQIQALNAGEDIIQATYRYDESSRQTVMMRKKEGSVDYKYFPEPNIPPIRLEPEFIESAINNLPELPAARLKRYQEAGLNDYDSKLLVANKELADYFDEVCAYTRDLKSACNWLLGEFSAYLTKNQLTLSENKIRPESLAELIGLINNQTISSKQAKAVFEEMIDGTTARAIIAKAGLKQISDDEAIGKLVEEAVNANPQSVIDYHEGKDRALGYLVGQVMKLSKGQANPAKTSKLILEALAKRKKEN